ncbi:uncharacterized protein RHOBADRAFT_55205 [Rhodotorula graminis WP1]|uniref:Uncharacterized protein n=1 Tax=Rhodotorula graminis (strain WP1) TaxID=578459 RepID=A0A0P9EI57_RHOGW|nr:uncharacterized protein RHOBADRAFT_55205 [Rhodotorula graminis WP1]KPV72952.1 hypothetical protein RHOBADRAFT_55205 [Rhodotorula graminis WP1]
MPPWTALVRNATTSSSSSSTAADYTPLPASPSPSSTLPLPGAATRAGHALRTRRRLVLVATAASTLFLVASRAAIVPDKHLPSAVTTAKQGVVDAAAATWRWDAASTANEAQELADELTGEDHLADLELPVDDVVDAPSGSAQGAVDPDWREPSSDEVECPASAQAQVGQAGFWAVTETSRLQYLVAPREPLDDAVPSSCLSQAVFSARLVSVSGDDTLDNVDTQTLVALDRPRRSVDQLSYFVSVPSDVAVPLGPYQLDVHLAFGFFPGALDGVPCGDEAETCVEGELGAAAGDQLRYVGERVEVLSGQVVHLVQEAVADLALCTDLSSLAGHWSNLAFFPTSPPCTLATPTLPLPFLVDAEARPTKPLWLHVVGDSNARNMFTHLAASLGEGRKVSASKVLDSPTHNGTHASVAFRYRDGAPPVEDGKALPDVVVTWQWWYEAAPVVAVESAQHEREDEGAKNDAFATAVAVNRDDLVSLVDTDLASFLRKSRLASALKHSPALKAVAKMVRPHRTYLSLGSHGEQLSLAGVSSSLDALFAESSGLSRAARDRANLRLFTTTLVDARYIPLARFPHQDLVRNNALVEAKNAFAARHPALGGEGRVIDVEALTRGIVDSDGWMKAGRHGPDAVHFRGEVYDEWVRLVWTDLLQGVNMSSTTVEQDDDEDEDDDGVEALRRRWKRRLSWDESLAEDDDDDDDGL